MTEIDSIIDELGFKKKSDDVDIWIPEHYGFVNKKITDNLVRGDIYYKGNYELRSLEFDFWLLRRKIKNDRGNSEMVVRFYIKILPVEIEFANQLFTLGLR